MYVTDEINQVKEEALTLVVVHSREAEKRSFNIKPCHVSVQILFLSLEMISIEISGQFGSISNHQIKSFLPSCFPFNLNVDKAEKFARGIMIRILN